MMGIGHGISETDGETGAKGRGGSPTRALRTPLGELKGRVGFKREGVNAESLMVKELKKGRGWRATLAGSTGSSALCWGPRVEEEQIRVFIFSPAKTLALRDQTMKGSAQRT